jgi:hypothetical protein
MDDKFGKTLCLIVGHISVLIGIANGECRREAERLPSLRDGRAEAVQNHIPDARAVKPSRNP